MDPTLKVDGSNSFVLGMDSYTLPSNLQNGEYELGLNLINRGGIAQTRPGSVSLFDLPAGKIQGCVMFQPSAGAPHLVFAVSGKIYASPAPFRTYTRIGTLQFSTTSKFVTWANCIQSTYYDEFGEFQFLNKPKAVLIIQDGATRAAYWDGSASAHINPTPSGEEITPPDEDGTKIGLWMVWSNNRLWVSRGSQVFASDLGNPLKFTETQYLNEGRAFHLPGPCTGMVETTDRSGIIAFTQDSGDFIQSSIQDRLLWLETPAFQKTVLPNIGCIAPRSIVQQYGLIWWYTPKGLINLNTALQLNISSRLDIQDNEMFGSKFGFSTDLTGVCGGFVENMLFHAVPYGAKENTRVHILDQAPFEGEVNSWPSYWEGWRPVEFCRGLVKSQERIFCVSQDYDGVGRMWELFRAEKTDNGIPITSYVITRQHQFGNLNWKRFMYAEVDLRNVLGDTAIMIAAAGVKGAFQSVGTKEIKAIHGQIYHDSEYGEDGDSTEFAGSRPQYRIVRSTENSDPSSCNEECVETKDRGLIDRGFSLCVIWSGIAGVAAYRIFYLPEPKDENGVCEDNETADNLLTPDGCGIDGLYSLSEPFTTYTSTQTYEEDEVSSTVTQTSVISQADADRKALATATWYVQSELGTLV